MSAEIYAVGKCSLIRFMSPRGVIIGTYVESTDIKDLMYTLNARIHYENTVPLMSSLVTSAARLFGIPFRWTEIHDGIHVYVHGYSDTLFCTMVVHEISHSHVKWNVHTGHYRS